MKTSKRSRKPIVRKSGYDLDITDNGKSEAEDSLQIFPNARIYKTNLTKKFRERKKYTHPDIQEIKSIIPGVVISLNVTEGQHVTKGTQIMIFEAMKMHNIVLSPIDGTVEKIHVKEGQKVPKGDVIVFIKASKKTKGHSSSSDGDAPTYVSNNDDIISDGDLGLIV